VLFDVGALEALNPGAVIMLMATCSSADAQAIGAAIHASPSANLSMPRSPAESSVRKAGLLTIMAAGTGYRYFSQPIPILSAFGDKIFRIGDGQWGQGSTVKTLNQLLCGVHIAAAAEAMAMAEKAGRR
jgi:putative dehydrogenase